MTCRESETEREISLFHHIMQRLQQGRMHLWILLVVGKLPNDQAPDPVKNTGQVQLMDHTVHLVRFLTDILEKENPAFGYLCIFRAKKRGENREIATKESSGYRTWSVQVLVFHYR